MTKLLVCASLVAGILGAASTAKADSSTNCTIINVGYGDSRGNSNAVNAGSYVYVTCQDTISYLGFVSTTGTNNTGCPTLSADTAKSYLTLLTSAKLASRAVTVFWTLCSSPSTSTHTIVGIQLS